MVLALVVATTLLTLVASTAQAEEFSDIELTQSSEYLLRLTDLPTGYGFDDGDCGEIEPADPPPSVAAFVRQFRPEGCAFEYERLFRTGDGPSAASVVTAAMAAPSVGVAEMAAALGTDLIDYFAEDSGGYTEVAPAATFGDVTRLFHLEVDGENGSILFWRDGAVLAALIVTAKTHAAADVVAFSLAARQQAHIDVPSRYTAADADDSLVELDDPRIRVPVYWLGERFDPGHGFPSARPDFAFGRSLLVARKTNSEFAIGYTKGLALAGWTRSGWAYTARHGKRRDWTWHCTRSRRLAFPQGHAILYAAYKKDYARCPSRPPRHYFAQAFIGRTVIGVQKLCGDCPPYPSFGFNSYRGLATIVRNLEIRPRTAH